MHSETKAKKSINWSNWVRRSVLVVIVIILIFTATSMFDEGETLVVRDKSTYQAVFLDNGQVYFGRLSSINQDLWSLTDIYYLRAGTVQQTSPQGQPEGSPAGQGQQIDLIKLGAELHAPEDEMIVNKDHVIFYEDLRPDSEVIKLIREHKNNT